MSDPSEKITLALLPGCVGSASIAGIYDWLGYDYAQEAKIDSGEGTAHRDRERFLSLFCWSNPPTGEGIRRLFNQINTFYAERWILEQSLGQPEMVMLEANRLCLFRQSKTLGLRKKDIAFGYRKHLDFMDPLRRSKWLRGVSPEFLKETFVEWCMTVDASSPDFDMAIALTMAFICIHPFSDANGRVARLILTWLCKRWNLEVMWLEEAQDGELLRTGHGVRSTEYLMAMFMIKLAHGRNTFEPGPSSFGGSEMLVALRETFVSMRAGDVAIVETEEFRDLKRHLLSEGHFRSSSPRFNCLNGILC